MDTVNRRTALKVSALLGAGAFASRALMPVAEAAEQTSAARHHWRRPHIMDPLVRQERSGKSIKRLARFFIQYVASARSAMALHALANFQA